jgi:hypothetical protein
MASMQSGMHAAYHNSESIPGPQAHLNIMLQHVRALALSPGDTGGLSRARTSLLCASNCRRSICLLNRLTTCLYILLVALPSLCAVQDVKDNHEEAAKVAPQTLKLCTAVGSEGRAGPYVCLASSICNQ